MQLDQGQDERSYSSFVAAMQIWHFFWMPLTFNGILCNLSCGVTCSSPERTTFYNLLQLSLDRGGVLWDTMPDKES